MNTVAEKEITKFWVAEKDDKMWGDKRKTR